MEVVFSSPQILSEPQRRGSPLPLSQLVEERRRSSPSIPNHLLQSKIYAKLKSNCLIEAEPPELHFSGFELGKDYLKTLKLINISSEVMNIHIIPTQTKHFQTTYTKKYRLIPGLAYTLKVRFCPDEWRYFYDSVRVHCKGEENLLIPVHAYPVIDDLHIPPRIDLSAVPLGQSVNHDIPLRCSCPIDFEFQVYVIQPHEAFSIHPLTGVIPANGEVKLTVTFSPLRYETSQVTVQVVVSQFNTKPHLCTITGSSAPHTALGRRLKKKEERREERRESDQEETLNTTISLNGNSSELERKSVSAENKRSSPARSKTKYRSIKEADNSKTQRDQTGPKPPLDICTPAGIAKMLIKDTNKLSSKALKEALSCGSLHNNKQMKEARFIKKIQQNVREEQANHMRWQVHLGKDALSEQTRRQILEEREITLHEYMVKRGDVRQEEDFAAGKPKLSSRRVLCESGQAPEGAPSFRFYPSFQWDLKQRALRLFQQAARKVVIRCRMKRRLTRLKKLTDGRRNLPSTQAGPDYPVISSFRNNPVTLFEEKTLDLKFSADKVFPFSFPVFPEDDPLTHGNLTVAPVDPIDVTVTTRIPLFKLQVPQHYKLKGYQPVSTWEAFNSYIPTTLARMLRTDTPDELGALEVRSEAEQQQQQQQRENKQEAVEENKSVQLSFTIPEALLRPFPANPLRIFNPAPGLQAYKQTPKYLESDLEFHLCPLPRFTEMSQTHLKPLDREEVIKGVMTWKNFHSVALNSLSIQPAPTSSCRALCRSVDYSIDTLPPTAPPPLAGLPDDLSPLMDEACEGSGVALTPEMIRAQFLSEETLVSNGNIATATKSRRHSEVIHRSQFNQMGRQVMTRLLQFGADEGASSSEVDDCE